MNRWRMALAGAVLAVGALLLASCAPAAQAIADAVDTSDGAVLSYVEHGVSFDPGATMARGVIIRAEGDNLAITAVPDGATCTLVTDKADCRLFDVSEPVTIGMTGKNVVSNATWRRSGSSTVFLTFAYATP